MTTQIDTKNIDYLIGKLSLSSLSINNLPLEITRIMISFLLKKDKESLVLIDKKMNDYKYYFVDIRYIYAKYYNDYTKSKVTTLIDCFDNFELYKFKNLKYLAFSRFFNDKEPIKKSDLPNSITTLNFGLFFNNGGKPFKKDDLPDNIKYLFIKGSAKNLS